MKNLRLLFSLGILSNCIAYDQATKQIARSAALKQSSFLEWLDIALGCRYIKNSRGLVELSGIPEDLRVLFFVAMLMVLFMALVELLLVAKKAPTMVIGGMSLIVGGGVSNLLDRILDAGRVTDFISLKSSQGLSIVFNYADLAIFVGIGLLLIHAVYYSLSFAQSAP